MESFTFNSFVEKIRQVNDNIPDALTEHTPAELMQMRGVYLSGDQLRGFAVSSDDELTSVFNLGRRGVDA